MGGGTAYRRASAFAKGLADELGESVIVETGRAAAIIGTENVARNADGYSLLMATFARAVNSHP